MHKIVILGAGFAGLTLATELDFLAKEGKAEITLVEKNSSFSMGFSMQWAMIGRRKPEEGYRPYSSLRTRHVKFVQEEIVSIDTKDRHVRTKSLMLPYDDLVIALGAELKPELIPGLAENSYNLCDTDSVMRLRYALEKINHGTIVILISSVPFKCPPAPYEYALLIDDLLRKRNVRGRIRLVLTTPEPQPMPVAGKAVGSAVEALLSGKGIEYIPLLKPKIVERGKIIYENGFELSYDLLCAMPPHRSPAFLADSGLADSTGFVPVTLGSFEAVPHVYAVGDAASIRLPNGSPHPKAGVFAEAQAMAVAKRLISEISGKEAEPYEGKGVCFIDTGGEQAAPAEIHLLSPEGPKANLGPPSEEGLEGKKLFESERLKKWFGG